MKLWTRLLFSLFVLGPAPRAMAAACCGGGFAAPALISSDDQTQFTSSWIYSEIAADVYTDGLWRRRQQQESSQTLKIEGAFVWKDRFQSGLTVPVVQRSRADQKDSGLGDVALTLGYEYLPDWDYNPYRPKGIGFFQLTLPTGRSIFESNTTTGLDARGRGFWALGVGTLLTKTFSRWDFFLSPEIHRSFPKDVEQNGLNNRLVPGWGGSSTAGLGFNTTHLRFGGSIAWTYEDPVTVEGSQSSVGSPQRFATGATSISYLASNEWAATLGYFDQTWFGDPTNTTLSKGASLLLQRRWPR